MALGSFGIATIAHAVLAVFLIIELGLTAYVVDANDGNYSGYNFQLFNSIWSILVLIYIALAPVFFEAIYTVFASLAATGVTALFWFAGSTAVAAKIGVPDCGSNFCHSVQASVAFGYFLWAIFTAMTVLDFLGFRRSGGAGADSVRKPGSHVGA